MKQNRLILLKVLLVVCGVYYLIGAFCHFFGLTLFPFYDGRLYTPYHDTVIALVAVIFSILLFTIARNPVKNIEALNAIIFGTIIAIIFSLWIILKVDFVQLGAPAKKFQTVVEMFLLIIYVVLLLILKPRKVK